MKLILNFNILFIINRNLSKFITVKNKSKKIIIEGKTNISILEKEYIFLLKKKTCFNIYAFPVKDNKWRTEEAYVFNYYIIYARHMSEHDIALHQIV